jgi:hypothetical protein
MIKDNTDIVTNHKDEVYKLLLDRNGLQSFLEFMQHNNSSEVDYGVNTYGEVFIDIKNTKKIDIVPINFSNIINKKIDNIRKLKTNVKKNKEIIASLEEALTIIYDIIND